MAKNNPLAEIFDDIFDKMLRKQLPHHAAYEEAEEEFKEEFNHRKYSSFDSYRKVRSKRIKKGN